MTEPTPPLPVAATDPITAILLAVTRIEGNLAGALEQLKRHDAELVELRHAKEDHGSRLTALETKAVADEGHAQRRISDRAVFWTMVSALAVVASVLAAVIITKG